MNQAANDTPLTPQFLTLGLDIGIASVGWAVLNESRIADIGACCFDKAETAKEGESLNLVRRQARLLRRRLYRRSWRLIRCRFLKQHGLIDNAAFFKHTPTDFSVHFGAVARVDIVIACCQTKSGQE